MRAFSHAWSLPVMWQRWRSYHSICHSRKPHAHENLMALHFIEAELLPIEVLGLHCRNRNFRPLLLLWPWPWLDDLYIWTWPVFPPQNIPDVRKWTSYVKVSKLIVWQTYTDRHTDRRRWNYIPRRFLGGQHKFTNNYDGGLQCFNISWWVSFRNIAKLAIIFLLFVVASPVVKERHSVVTGNDRSDI